jgi:hypothetical protein
VDISAAGPVESAVFTFLGTLALRGSLGFALAPGHEGRNTIVMLLLTCLPASIAFAISEFKRRVVLWVCVIMLLPALVASAWLLPPEYRTLRWAYAILAGLVLLIGAVMFLLRFTSRRSRGNP